MLTFPIDPYGYPWPFPTLLDPIAGFPSTPTNGLLVSADAAPPEVVVQWNGSTTADHYDIYRSISPISVGTKINLSPITQPGATPWTFQYADNVTNSLTAPVVGQQYYYRAVAVDGIGNVSIPSDAVAGSPQDDEFVHDQLLATIVGALRADSTLVAMVGGLPENIRFHKRIKEQGDVYPFVAVWRSNWTEDKRFRDQRHGVIEYTFSVVHNQASSPIVINVLNRICKVLDGEPGKRALSANPSASVMMSFYKGAGPELFDESLKLWFQDGVLAITVEFYPT